MKLIVKTLKGQAEPAEMIVRSSAQLSAPRSLRSNLEVARVFPDQEKGNRSRLVSIALPDDTPSTQVAVLLQALEQDHRLEYVQVPPRKRPLILPEGS